MAQPPPERRSAEEWLGVADRHLAEADERLRRVEELVLAGPVPDGRGRALAEELLETMRRSREAMLVHRKLLGELTGVADPDPGSDELQEARAGPREPRDARPAGSRGMKEPNVWGEVMYRFLARLWLA